jgi:hypothetical protein
MRISALISVNVCFSTLLPTMRSLFCVVDQSAKNYRRCCLHPLETDRRCWQQRRKMFEFEYLHEFEYLYELETIGKFTLRFQSGA